MNIRKTKEKRYLLGIQISYDIKNRVVENNLSKQLRTHVPSSCCIRQNAVVFLLFLAAISFKNLYYWHLESS